MTPSSTAELLDALESASAEHHNRPWGRMLTLGASKVDLTVKHISIPRGARTSLQYHERKDELLIVLNDFAEGFVSVWSEDRRVVATMGLGLHAIDGADLDDLLACSGGHVIRVKPGMLHRVTGPMEYLEVSTFDGDDDTIRIADDYGRVVSQ